MSKSLRSSLVSLSKFISASVSELSLDTALWAVLLSFTIALMQFLLLYYYKDSLMHVLVSHTIYYIAEVPGALSWVSCPLMASPTERDQHCGLCVAPGGDLWHIPYFPQSLDEWSIMVTNSGGHRLWWWQLAYIRCLAYNNSVALSEGVYQSSGSVPAYTHAHNESYSYNSTTIRWVRGKSTYYI